MDEMRQEAENEAKKLIDEQERLWSEKNLIMDEEEKERLTHQEEWEDKIRAELEQNWRPQWEENMKARNQKKIS